MATSDDLKRWVEAGLIEAGTADAIDVFESQRSAESRVSRGIEAIAYLGAALVLVAVWVLIAQTWDAFGPWAQLGLSGLIAVILFTVGLILGRSDEPAVNRAQTFAWALAVGAVALAAQIVFEELVTVDDDTTFLLVSLISLLTAAGLWWMRKSVLQVVAMAIAAGMTVTATVSLSEGYSGWRYGVSLTGLGILWLVLTWRGVLKPSRTSYALGAIGVLLIAVPEGGDLPWPLLGLGMGLALMAISVVLNENVLLGLGVVGLFIYIPMTVFELFGDSLGVPVALLITGLVLLGVVVVTARLRKETDKTD